ncbi:MAG: hypothetical protein ACR2IQ_03075 [Minisyncoccia bacterium]
MKDEDISIKPDGTIECVMTIGDNPCVVQIVPTETTSLATIRNMIENPFDEPKNFYINRNDFYMFCRRISGKKAFRGLTIINPQKEEFEIVINVDEKLETSTLKMNEDVLEEIIYSKKRLGRNFVNKPYFIYISM